MPWANSTAGGTTSSYFNFYSLVTASIITYIDYNSYTTNATGYTGYTGNFEQRIPQYIPSGISLRTDYNSEIYRPEIIGCERPESVGPRSDHKPDPAIEAAKEAAKTLLLDYLDEDNKKRFLNNQKIEIVSKIFKDIKYHIPLSRFDKICALKDNKVVDRMCLIVKEPESLPLEDVILTKILHILHNEDVAIRTANHFSDVESENLLTRMAQIMA